MRISTSEHLRGIWWLFQETVESRSQAGTLEFRKWIKGQLHCRWELCSEWCGVGSALCLSLPPSVHSLDSACYVPDCFRIPWLLCPPCLGDSFWSWIGRGDLKLGILSPSFLSHVCEHEILGGLSTSFLKTFCHLLFFSLPTLTQTALVFRCSSHGGRVLMWDQGGSSVEELLPHMQEALDLIPSLMNTYVLL